MAGLTYSRTPLPYLQHLGTSFLFSSFLLYFLKMSKEAQVFRDILTVVKWNEILGHLI